MSRSRSPRSVIAQWCVLLCAMFLLMSIASSPRKATAAPDAGPGGPILVITSPSSTYGAFYAEILRNEGLNEFTVSDSSAIDATTLASYDIVVLAKMPLTAAQVTTLTNWVNGGGRLIAMAPDAQLAGLLKLTATGASMSDGYMLVDTSASPGNGIVAQTMQFHGSADLYSLNGATRIASLYTDAFTATSNPAVSLATAGAGKAAAFAYDLATSVVLTRQGNPAWATQERDGFAPIRSDDKFFGNATGDVKPDWVDLNKVAIPQADEQQRLFANLILEMNRDKKPLPKFWYFPNGKKAVVIMTGDDHGNGGTAPRFDQFKAASPANCSVANWECVRGTSYIYPNTPLTDAQVTGYTADGFEIGLHINTGCNDFTAVSLESTYVDQMAQWQSSFPSLPAPITERHHCIVWSDWTTGAVVQRNHGIRLDTSYYYWPPTWANNVPGVFTGSAMPMRFSALDGTVLDVYQAVSQMTDESGQTYPFTIDTLLDRAVGTEAYYGAYTINAHTDVADSPEATAVVASAQARGVPIVSSRQMLAWLDARNGSSFSAFNWTGSSLNFSVSPGLGANGLQVMLPTLSSAGVLNAITRAGTPVTYTVKGVKGVEYAFFSGDGGNYVATYAADPGTPSVIATSPSNGATSVPVGSAITATFSKAMTAATINGSTVDLRNSATNALVTVSVTYDAVSRNAIITPAAPLAPATAYTATIHGGSTDPRVKDASGNPATANFSWSFTTVTAAGCPCSAWSSTTVPANPSAADPGPVEVGVKFRSDQAGYITGIRFYKGATNTGTHIGNLWSISGGQLASATFNGETASGWQQVNFATPVAITANTVYVASYFAPNGNYAADLNYFASAGVDNTPIHLLKDGDTGGNGVYAYGAGSSFPAQSYQAANYWVDVVFTATTAPDTTPPTVISTSPTNGATGVLTSSSVSASFSEAMDPASIAASFQLRDASNAAVAATVSYNTSTRVATLTPSAALAASSSYSAIVLGGATDPRAKDLAGNATAANTNWSFTTAGTVVTCSSSPNPIVAENCQPGNPASEWDVSGAGDGSIQGFATQISVNKGETVSFKVNTNASNYRIDIYRLGYYGGLGARKMTSVLPSATLPQTQPSCMTDSNTGLIDCGNWAVSASWATPSTAVSGIYIARLVRTDTGGASHMVFIVRDDARNSDLLFQTSDTTWQAYNEWGGNSLYAGGPATGPNRAYKVSYNRPFMTRAPQPPNQVGQPQDWLFNNEYPMLRFLESNGYDVSYQSGVDTDRSASLLLNHKAFLSVGHDEYWSGTQRANVEQARNSGIHLAFFSGNEVFWKTRWENSIDGSGTPYRTLVSYKETHANAKIDPSPLWTGTWMDPRFSPPADGGRPQNALTGTLFTVNTGSAVLPLMVPAGDGKMRFWRNTSVASLATGTTATLTAGVLGYEWDSDVDNGFRPPGLFRMSTTASSNANILLDYGSTYGAGNVVHSLTLYKHASGARVFGAGTVQWAWGLDSCHDPFPDDCNSSNPPKNAAADASMRQATVNLFADMNVQPALLQPGLTAAVASTDTTAPTSAITSPVAGATPQQGIAITVSGTATDTGGNVGGVEVSTDGGTTWHPATGRGTWTYSWTPATSGSATLRSRAVDDSGNIETPGVGVTVAVQPRACPCTIWSASAVPDNPAIVDPSAVNVGVSFKSDQAGFITGLRFYKGTGNTGTHVGTLWSSSGQQLATATFTGETATGWQQVNFATPVSITANTVYVASYLAPAGNYAGDSKYFQTTGVDSPPLHALQDGVGGVNGVYVYGSTTAFPSATYQSTNYWVDVVFTTSSSADTTPPTVTAVTPASGATGVAVSTAVTATFSEAMTAASISTASFELRNASNALITSTVAYNATTNVATLQPSQALASGTYTATVKGGATDPRVKDAAGNALAANSSWSFTVAGDTTPPTVTAVTPASGATGVAVSTAVTATFSEAMTAASISTASFELRNASNALITSTVAYNATTNVATLQPSQALASGTYTATVKGGATDPRVKDAAGNALAANSTWSFTVVAADTTPPTVTTVTPASGATGVAVSTSVTATFSEAMTAASISTASFELRNASNALITSTVAYNAATNVATLQPSSSLASGTYTARVKGGTTDPRVKDAAGNALAADRTWSFTVTGDSTPPTVTAIAPASGATGIVATTSVTATFSEAMTASTISTSTFDLRTAANVVIPSTVTYNATTRVATLQPSQALVRGTAYTATVRGGATDPRVKDLSGNPLAANRSWSFTVDGTAPTVTAISPGSGAVLVSKTTSVTATFSEAMDASTIGNTTFQLRNSSNALVPAVVTYNATTRVATLKPNSSLGSFVLYTVTISGGATDPRVKDVSGNALAANRTWTFRTTF